MVRLLEERVYFEVVWYSETGRSMFARDLLIGQTGVRIIRPNSLYFSLQSGERRR